MDKVTILVGPSGMLVHLFMANQLGTDMDALIQISMDVVIRMIHSLKNLRNGWITMEMDMVIS